MKYVQIHSRAVHASPVRSCPPPEIESLHALPPRLEGDI